MIVTYKYKLYKTKKLKYLNNKIDIAGIIWNHCIALHKRYYKLYKKCLNVYRLQKHITKLKKLDKHKFWSLVNSQTIQDITERIDKSYKQFFSKIKKKQKARPPKFQKVKKYKSITFKQTGFKLLEDNKLKIQNKVFKYSNSRDIEGEVKTLTIKRTDSGTYFYVVFDKKINNSINSKLGKITGIDVGLKTFLTLSDGTQEKSPEFFKSSLKSIQKLHKNFSSKKKGSNNREKARISLSKEYKKVTNKRRDYFFKLANKLTREYSYIFIEDLNLRGWKKLWGRKTSDIAIGEFFSILEHQGTKNSCVVHKIDRFFASSKLCYECGWKKKDLQLSDRVFECKICGHIEDRDLNASKNIKREGSSSLRLDDVRLPNLGSNCCLILESTIN
jgi:putative transposase